MPVPAADPWWWAAIPLSAGIGAFLSASFVLWVERRRRPALSIEIEKSRRRGEVYLVDDTGTGRVEHAIFLRLEVGNQRMDRLLAWAVDRHPALSCRSRFKFYGLDDQPKFEGRAMQGRWASTPEPVTWHLDNGRLVPLLDPGRARDSVDIGPGTEEVLDVAFRPEHHERCRGWHNRMIGVHEANLRPEDDFPLEKGRYRVEITVQTGGREFSRKFVIVNDERWDDFNLQPC